MLEEDVGPDKIFSSSNVLADVQKFSSALTIALTYVYVSNTPSHHLKKTEFMQMNSMLEQFIQATEFSLS